MDKDSIQKGTLLGLSSLAVASGFQLAQTEVWAGVVVIIVGISLPYVREYLKK